MFCILCLLASHFRTHDVSPSSTIMTDMYCKLCALAYTRIFLFYSKLLVCNYTWPLGHDGLFGPKSMARMLRAMLEGFNMLRAMLEGFLI